MKIGTTSKGNIKIVMSDAQARSLYKLLDEMTIQEIDKYTGGENSCDVYDIWYDLEKIYS